MGTVGVIETGVDRLIKLVHEKKKVAVQQAARELNVPREVLEEWIDFLEKEGVISVQFEFATPYIIEKELLQQEVKSRVQRFALQKEGFAQKVEETLSILDREGKPFKGLGDQLEMIRKKLGEEVEFIKKDLVFLSEYEQAKIALDAEIVRQQHDFRRQMEKLERQILQEQRRYGSLVLGLQKEKLLVSTERQRVQELRHQEGSLKKRLAAFTALVNTLDKKLSREDRAINKVGSHVNTLTTLTSKTLSTIETKKNRIGSLMAQSKRKKQQIAATERRILNALSRGAGKKKAGVQEQLKMIFAKKNKIGMIMHDLQTRHAHLERDLLMLVRRAKALEAMKAPIKTESVAALKKQFATVEKRKQAFEQNVTSLIASLA